MKSVPLFITCLLLMSCSQLQAQYFDPHTDLLTGRQPLALPHKAIEKEGYTLDLGHGNQLFIPRMDSYPGSKSGLKILGPTQPLFEQVEKAYEALKDSLNNPLTIKKIQYLDFNGNIKILVHQKPASGEQTYYRMDGQTSLVKPDMDTITIAKVDSTSQDFKAAVLIFKLNSVSDLNKIVSADLVDRFIDSIDAAIPEKVANHLRWRYNVYGHYRLDDAQHFSGHLKTMPNATSTLTLGLSADIQNIKNSFVPSASAGLSIYFHYRNQANSYNGFGLYWTPYFFFDKDADGKTNTYRNDFLFATYIAVTDKKTTNPTFDFYLPVSLGYLIHRKGNFLEKNSFGFNMFGVKYGNATLKPFIYFHNLLKGVTPSIQLSIGIGK